MKKAFIIGASTGIGREVAVQLSRLGYETGLVARRAELLQELQNEIPGKSHISCMDISDTEVAREKLGDLIALMGKVDIIILNAGIGIPKASWQEELKIIQTNVIGFAALANYSYDYFKRSGEGCLVGVSSIAGLRGSHAATAYCASKAFMSNYLEGLKCRAIKDGLSITITDIIPGFVETPMTENLSYKFWVATASKAAAQMIAAILKKKGKAFITKRWTSIALLMRILPLWLYSRISLNSK